MKKRFVSGLLIALLLSGSMSAGAADQTGTAASLPLIQEESELGGSAKTEETTEAAAEDAGLGIPNGWIKTEEGWRLYQDGVSLTGWQSDGGKWYYLGSDGVMLDGWQQIGGSWYLFGGGAMKTGWQKSGGKWYYLADSGKMQTGWKEIGGKRYYLTSTGAMKTGSITEGSTVYTLDASGAVVSSKNISSLSNTSLGWGQGTQVDSLNRPVGSLSYQEKYGKYDAYFIGSNEKVIYLTFDEGYENGYTASLLDTLKKKGVTATFFITGDYLKSQPELVQRMLDDGHTVGSHTENHLNLVNSSISKRESEISTLHQQMQDQYGYTMTLLRTPEGVFSEQVLAQAQGMGYKTVFWSFAYKDWDPNNQMATSTAYQKAVAGIHPGAIYLLHAVSKTNAAILGDLIDEMRRQGYTFGVLQ